MYFKEKEDTNIDKEFREENLREKGRSALKVFVIIMGILFVIGIIVFIIFMSANKLELIGSKEITIYEGSTYTEPGYNAYDMKKNLVNEKVTTSGEVDTSKIGSYTLKYKYGLSTKKRIINVVEKPQIATIIHLTGDKTITLNTGDTYEEPGYSAVDAIDGDLTDKVEINSNVDTTKAGTYRIIYSVVNSENVTTTETRAIIVK